MICPVDKKDMFVIEYKQIELDYCHSCNGVWFDAGELELLLEAGGLKDAGLTLGDVLLLPEAPTSEKKRRCPICANKMKKVKIGGEAGVMIDACFRHHGLWFDGGEVADLIKIISARSTVKKETESEIMGFLKDVFGSQ
jgi:Zn-finger nucleic acid-binding protein